MKFRGNPNKLQRFSVLIPTLGELVNAYRGSLLNPKSLSHKGNRNSPDTVSFVSKGGPAQCLLC